jgi:YesN/AraC family two-component response regulator
MSFTTEAIDLTPIKNPTGPAEFDLPSKEFVGYDPKGTMSVTGSPIERPEAQNPKQENTTEAVAPAATEEESVQLSPKISALARKEQAQRKREQALAQREKALADKLADAEKYAQLKSRMSSKDFSAAEELGLTNEEYVQYQLDRQASLDPTEQRIRQAEEKLTQFEKAQEERTVKEYQQNQELWKQEISKVVSENPEFSTIKELGLEAMVLQHVNDSFDEDGIELTAEQAAKEIEEEAVRRAEKFASVSKIKQKFSEPPKVLGAPKTSPKTITQGMTVTSQKQSAKPFHLLSESEQIAEAIRRVQAIKQGR